MGITLTVLGSGTVVPDLARASSGYLVQTGREKLLFDAGSGVLRRLMEAGAEPWELDRIFLTHFHPDHTADLIPLLFAYNYAVGPWLRERPLTLYGPTGLHGFMDGLTAAFPWVAAKNYELRRVEMGEESQQEADWKVTPYRVVHSDLEARAYRIESGGAVMCYSGDTRECEGLERAARGVDLLLCEASIPKGFPQKGDHMFSDQVGRLATRAGAGRLLLTHLYPLPDDVDLVAEAAEHYDGPVELACDGCEYTIHGGQPS